MKRALIGGALLAFALGMSVLDGGITLAAFIAGTALSC